MLAFTRLLALRLPLLPRLALLLAIGGFGGANSARGINNHGDWSAFSMPVVDISHSTGSSVTPATRPPSDPPHEIETGTRG